MNRRETDRRRERERERERERKSDKQIDRQSGGKINRLTCEEQNK